jgi:hypothetical protein
LRPRPPLRQNHSPGQWPTLWKTNATTSVMRLSANASPLSTIRRCWHALTPGVASIPWARSTKCHLATFHCLVSTFLTGDRPPPARGAPFCARSSSPLQ